MPGDNLEYFVQCLPRIQELTGSSGTIAVSDKEKYLMHLNGTEISLPVEPGDPVKAGGVADAAMKEGRRVSRLVGREVLGVPYIGIGTPLKNEMGRVIGSLIVALPITLQEELNSRMGEMIRAMDILERNTASLASSSQEYSGTISFLDRGTEEISAKMKIMDSILGLIREISDQTHLLGLNAAIEAARAGDSGRGFNVVAGEIRKLAGKTRDSLAQINAEMKDIMNSMGEIAGTVHQIAAVTQEQTSATIEISRATSDLKEESERILDLAEKITAR